MRLMHCDVCVLCGVASGTARCRIFASCVRAFASVHAVETLQHVGTRRRRKYRTIPCVSDAHDEHVFDVTVWAAVDHMDTRNMRQWIYTQSVFHHKVDDVWFPVRVRRTSSTRVRRISALCTLSQELEPNLLTVVKYKISITITEKLLQRVLSAW